MAGAVAVQELTGELAYRPAFYEVLLSDKLDIDHLEHVLSPCTLLGWHLPT